MVSHSALVTVMERAARKAAPRLRRDFNEVEQLQVSRKGPADFVSNADFAAERTIRESLKQARPSFGFLLEEGGEVEGEEGAPRWIVDPLDGTSNFLHGIPHFAISIAVEAPTPSGGWEVISALVYQPLTDETFWADKNRGSWLKDRRLRVSSRKKLDVSVFATGIPFKGHGDYQQHARILENIAPHTAGIRRFGAASLDLAWVAAGRYDGYWESDLQFWDWAAGWLLIREAGGYVSDYRGGQEMQKRQEILATNGLLHSRLHRLIADSVR